MSTLIAESVWDDPNKSIRYIEGSEEIFDEKRYTCVGRESGQELCLIVFCIRHERFRIISAHRCDPSKGRQLGYQYA